MSARFTPLIFLCRMAVYAAALLVLATARLPDVPTYEVAAAPTRPSLGEGRPAEQRLQPRRHDAPEPNSHSSPIRIVLVAVLVIGVLAEARRLPWR